MSIWNVAMVLGDIEEDLGAERLFRKAIAGYKSVLGEKHPGTIESGYGIMPWD
jgi:hypothetical protein